MLARPFLALLALAAVAPLSARGQERGLDVEDLDLEALLNPTVGISTRTASTLDESPGIVAVVDRKEIEATGATTLGEVLRLVPGFDVAPASLATGDPADVFFARGVKTDFGQTTLVLLNGRNRFNDLMLASPWLAHRISADLIERVEVIRGPGSSLYGGSAFAGVINVVTRDVVDEPGTSLSASYGTYQRASVHGTTRHVLGGWKIGAQARGFAEGGATYPSLGVDRTYDVAQGGGDALLHPERVTDGVRPSYDPRSASPLRRSGCARSSGTPRTIRIRSSPASIPPPRCRSTATASRRPWRTPRSISPRG
jgi:outer membrane receptor protein involved in Fe transport